MVPAIGAVCAVPGKSRRQIGSPNTASPMAQGKEITMIKRMAELICSLTFFISFCAKDIVSVGTQEAAIAEAMEIGTLISSLYFPEKTPHHTSILFSEYPCNNATFLKILWSMILLIL